MMRSMILTRQLHIVHKQKAANYSMREFDGALIIRYTFLNKERKEQKRNRIV